MPHAVLHEDRRDNNADDEDDREDRLTALSRASTEALGCEVRDKRRYADRRDELYDYAEAL